MVPGLVRDAVDSLIQRQLVPEEYRADLEQAVDVELRRKAKLFGTSLGASAMSNVIARRLMEQSLLLDAVPV